MDYGRQRHGIALTDPTATIASPHSVIPAADDPTRPPTALLELVREVEPREILVGIPLLMDGSEGEMAREARRFGRALEAATGVPVVEWDERLSTALAEREIRSSGLPAKRRRQKGLSDMVAAAVLLRGYLQSRGSG